MFLAIGFAFIDKRKRITRRDVTNSETEIVTLTDYQIERSTIIVVRNNERARLTATKVTYTPRPPIKGLFRRGSFSPAPP